MDAPLLARLTLGAVGAAVLLRGAYIYRPTLWMSAFGAGALGGWSALSFADPQYALIAALGGGVVTTAITAWVHRVGLVVIGGVLGAVVGFAVAEAVPAAALGGMIGALALPFAFDALLPFTTPAIGAVLVAAAAGLDDSFAAIGLLYTVGVVAQLATGRSDDDDR